MNAKDRLAEIDAVPLWLEAKEAIDLRNDHAETCRRVAAFDGKILGQLRDVPVPADLKAQILAGLSSSPVTDNLPAESSSAETSPRRFSRRVFNRWSLGVAVTAACLALVAWGWNLWWSADPLTVTGIIADVETSINEHPVFLEPAQHGTPPAGSAVPTQYLAEDSKGFRTLPLLGSHVVAHDLRVGTPVARLFVIPTDREISSRLKIDGPPYNPQSDTDGRCIGVWHSKDKSVVYVLVVYGDVDDYRRLVRHRAAA